MKPFSMPFSIAGASAGRSAASSVCARTRRSSATASTSPAAIQNSISGTAFSSVARRKDVAPCGGAAGRAKSVVRKSPAQLVIGSIQAFQPRRAQRRAIVSRSASGCAATAAKPVSAAHSSRSCRKVPTSAPRGNACMVPRRGAAARATGADVSSAPDRPSTLSRNVSSRAVSGTCGDTSGAIDVGCGRRGLRFGGHGLQRRVARDPPVLARGADRHQRAAAERQRDPRRRTGRRSPRAPAPRGWTGTARRSCCSCFPSSSVVTPAPPFNRYPNALRPKSFVGREPDPGRVTGTRHGDVELAQVLAETLVVGRSRSPARRPTAAPAGCRPRRAA